MRVAISINKGPIPQGFILRDAPFIGTDIGVDRFPHPADRALLMLLNEMGSAPPEGQPELIASVAGDLATDEQTMCHFSGKDVPVTSGNIVMVYHVLTLWHSTVDLSYPIPRGAFNMNKLLNETGDELLTDARDTLTVRIAERLDKHRDAYRTALDTLRTETQAAQAGHDFWHGLRSQL